MRLTRVAMDFSYRAAFGASERSAYATLLNDCMRGDATLFDRADGVEAAWAFMHPILEGWQDQRRSVPDYPAGSWGPREADELLESRWPALAQTVTCSRAKSCPAYSFAPTQPNWLARRRAGLSIGPGRASPSNGHFYVALSGGSTPRELYRLLATNEFRGQVDWPRVHLFWGDERAVPPDSPESNYGMARRELLLRVPIPPANVHRMEAEDPNIGRAAHNYEAMLREFLPLDDRGFPRFHLILLGMGRKGTPPLSSPAPNSCARLRVG